jgi:hypothetical protein
VTTANTQHRNTKPSKGRNTAKAPVRVARKPAGASVGAKAGSRMVPLGGPVVEPVYEGIIGSYNPLKSKFPLCSREEWAVAGPVVRAAVARLEGFEDRGLRPYLTGMTRLAVWAHREGFPMSIEVLLSHPMLEAHAATLSGSAGTFRSQLRRLAAANGVAVEATGLGFDRPGYSQPYTLEEVRALLRFASSHSNENRRRQLTGFLLLGAGCGFSRGDLRGVCKNDVHRHTEVPYVRTANRCTPILDLFVPEFEEFLGWCGDGPFVGVKSNGNITDRMASWVGERAGLPKLSGDRLRAFFIVEHLRRGTPLVELLGICGFTRTEALDSYLAFLPAPTTPCRSREVGSA